MVSHELSARVKFLDDSSYLLAASAPETSRFLISKRNALVEDNNIDAANLKMHQTCYACGTLVILGWESSLQIESQRTRRHPHRPRTAVYSCKECGAKTRHEFDVNPKPKYIISTGSKSSPMAENSTRNPTKSSKGSSSSKKRKRIKNSNLEALLHKSKVARSSSVQLNLMDFMDKA
ncbi:hypothetical protein K3495_g5294 [Podosphaera aphanis]|nr:hypothetical protein K3495_g5294 [Podosphaera aphanis]